jgi:hypothetical protein
VSEELGRAADDVTELISDLQVLNVRRMFKCKCYPAHGACQHKSIKSFLSFLFFSQHQSLQSISKPKMAPNVPSMARGSSSLQLQVRFFLVPPGNSSLQRQGSWVWEVGVIVLV